MNFTEFFRTKPEVSVRAPGRVNLLGEHTDYTGGLVLPMAIDRWTEALASRRNDGLFQILAPQAGGSATLRADGLPSPQKEAWLNYILGVVAELWPHANLRSGFNLMVSGNLPPGAGLASSAALTVSTIYALRTLFDIRLSDLDLVLAAQRAEHRYAGVQCGLMDPACSALAKKNSALLMNCRTMEFEPVPMVFEGIVAMVIHTGVKHALTTSHYNERVRECARTLEKVRAARSEVTCLGELSSGDLLELHAVARGRLDHVVLENERVRSGVAFLKVGDVEAFGKLMYQSHDSLAKLFDVSCPELDLLVEAARSQPEAALGAKMTGAGFGGAVVCLVRESHLKSFEEKTRQIFRKALGRAPTFYACRSADGARENTLVLKR
jgi:galactokinase